MATAFDGRRQEGCPTSPLPWESPGLGDTCVTLGRTRLGPAGRDGCGPQKLLLGAPLSAVLAVPPSQGRRLRRQQQLHPVPGCRQWGNLGLFEQPLSFLPGLDPKPSALFPK